MLLYFLLKKVICYCNFVTCNSLLPNTAGEGLQQGEIANVEELGQRIVDEWERLDQRIIDGAVEWRK